MHSPSIKEERRKKTMRVAKENKGQDGGERSKKTEKPQRSGREGISCEQHPRIRWKLGRNEF